MKQRQKTTTELTLFMTRSFIFVKNAQTTLTCSLVTLGTVAIFGYLSELNHDNFVSSLLCSELNKWEQSSLSNFDAYSTVHALRGIMGNQGKIAKKQSGKM